MNVKIMSRSKGHNAVAAAAYRSGERLSERPDTLPVRAEFNGEEPIKNKIISHDYRRRSGVMSSFIAAPSDAPAWSQNRAALWQKVEAAEKRKDAQLAREVVVSLPSVDIFDHLNAQNRALRLKEFYEKILKKYAKDNFSAEGMIADIALHEPSEKNDNRHFHAHIMLTMREVTADGFGKKERSWNDAKRLEHWRENWAHAVNDALKAHGIDGFVDHRTNEARGLDIGVTKPLGAQDHKCERFGVQTRAGNDNRKIKQDNLLEHKYLEKVFEHAPVAPIHDLETAITRAGFQDPETVIESLLEEGRMKRLSSCETGHQCDMYSFSPMVKRLDMIKAQSEQLHSRKNFALPHEVVKRAVKARGDKLVREALHYVSGGAGFKAVETPNSGHKTTFLSSMRGMYKDAGYDVIAVARNNEGKDAFKKSGFHKGVLTYRDLLRRFGDRYTGAKSKTPKVIIVDDAAGLSPLQDQEIFNTARKLNAKLIYIGQQKQKKKQLWQSLFASYKTLTKSVRLRGMFLKVSRENEAIREAFIQARTLDALKRQSARYLHIMDTQLEARGALLQRWFKSMKKRDDKRFILTSKDSDAQLFNVEIQKQRLEKGHLKAKHAKMFAATYKSDNAKSIKHNISLHWGDMIQFKKDYHDSGIEAGMRARVLIHYHDYSKLELDDGRIINVNLKEKSGFDLGYAGRVVSSTGTLEQGYLHHGRANAVDDAPLLYQRSEKPVRLYSDEQTALDLTSLAAQLLGRGHNLYDGYDEDTEQKNETDLEHDELRK